MRSITPYSGRIQSSLLWSIQAYAWLMLFQEKISPLKYWSWNGSNQFKYICTSSDWCKLDFKILNSLVSMQLPESLLFNDLKSSSSVGFNYLTSAISRRPPNPIGIFTSIHKLLYPGVDPYYLLTRGPPNPNLRGSLGPNPPTSPGSSPGH